MMKVCSIIVLVVLMMISGVNASCPANVCSGTAAQCCSSGSYWVCGPRGFTVPTDCGSGSGQMVKKLSGGNKCKC